MCVFIYTYMVSNGDKLQYNRPVVLSPVCILESPRKSLEKYLCIGLIAKDSALLLCCWPQRV